MRFFQSFNRCSLPSISAVSARVLHLGLPVILGELLILLFSLWQDITTDAVYAHHYYPLMLEHIMISLTALIIGAFLFDYIAKKRS